MKINFSKLGVLEQGSLEFADLTIICGENNTGKTYITYLVYCLLKTWKQLIEIDIKTEIKQLIEQGSIDIDLDKKIVKNWDKLSSQTVERFHENFPDMLAASGLLFENLKLDVELNLDLSWHQKEFKKEIRSGGGILLLSMQKDENSTILKLAAPKQENSKSISLSSLDDFIEEELFKIVLADTIPDVFIASTERTGATTFRKQLNLATSNLVDLLSQVQKDGEKSLTPHKLINAVYGSKDYAQPVKDNVIFINQLPDNSSKLSSLLEQYPKLLESFESIVGGKYSTNKEGVTIFQPKGTSLKLGLGEVSSSVRSLLIVWYWLRYYAKENSMLIVDEPELNLHPSNQRRFARFLADLVNYGVKVFITTHSDYIIKEFNTLIMLNNLNDEQFSIFNKKYKDYNREDKLDTSKIALYITREELIKLPEFSSRVKRKILKKAEINSIFGIEAISFDETINEMNAIQDTIYYEIEDDK